jgi:hypothetical protein
MKEKVRPEARDEERWKLLLESLRRELRGDPALPPADTTMSVPAPRH